MSATPIKIRIDNRNTRRGRVVTADIAGCGANLAATRTVAKKKPAG